MRMLTTRDFARRAKNLTTGKLGVSRTWVHHLILTGRIKVTRLSSGVVLIPESELIRYNAEPRQFGRRPGKGVARVRPRSA
jgi:predicted site-specific integrase-resolvase